jgi:hypothetical protein
MYTISRKEDHLLVQLDDDFNYYALKTIMRHETMLPDYAVMNDIWLIGRHHALLTLADLETVALDLLRMYPAHATRRKTAIVVEPGVTEAIVLLWIKQAEQRLPFICRAFHTLTAAEVWIASGARLTRLPASAA